MGRTWWIVLSLALAACLPGATIRDGGAGRVCTATAPCPVVSCDCVGLGSYRASRCTDACSDEATTCQAICQGGVSGPNGNQIWGATLVVGLAQFFGAHGTDERTAIVEAVGQCGAAAFPGPACSSGASVLELEPMVLVSCTGTFTSGGAVFTYEGISPNGRTDSRAGVVKQCITAHEVPGNTCGLGQFSCN